MDDARGSRLLPDEVPLKPYVTTTLPYLVFSVLWIVLSVVLSSLLVSAGLAAFQLFNAIVLLLQLVGVAAWLGLMFMAYDGRWFEVPVAAGIASNLSSKNNQPVQRQPPQQGQPPQQP